MDKPHPKFKFDFVVLIQGSFFLIEVPHYTYKLAKEFVESNYPGAQIFSDLKNNIY